MKKVKAYRPKRENTSVAAKIFEGDVIAKAAVCGCVSLEHKKNFPHPFRNLLVLCQVPKYHMAEFTPVLPISGQNFSRYFKVYLDHFLAFQNLNSFIPRIFAKLLKVVCRILVGKQ
jgi:hypothetical protein